MQLLIASYRDREKQLSTLFKRFLSSRGAKTEYIEEDEMTYSSSEIVQGF